MVYLIHFNFCCESPGDLEEVDPGKCVVWGEEGTQQDGIPFIPALEAAIFTTELLSMIWLSIVTL